MTDFESIEYSTVAGFVLSNIHKIPQIGDRFVYDNYMIEIVDVDDNRIDKILITKQSLQPCRGRSPRHEAPGYIAGRRVSA